MSGHKFILGIDQGTTGTTAILCNGEGRIISKYSSEIHQIYPQPGWVEHDPKEYVHNSLRVAREAINRSGIKQSDIKCVGITNQRETTVVWDSYSGEPVYNAIVWQCRRTASLCEELKQCGFDQMVRQKTGLPVDAYFSATKIRWILDHIPHGQSRAEAGELLFGTVETWLIWNFTKGMVHITDYSNASRTMLFNIHTLEWDHELIEKLSIPQTMLPRVIPSSHIYGEIAHGMLGDSSPVLASAVGDQQAALFGEACYKPGMAKNTYGTGSFVMLNTGEKQVHSKKGLITTIAWGLEKEVTYAIEGSIFITGAAVQWLRDSLGLITHAAETEALALSVSDNAGVYFVPAFVGLGAPYWDMYARGAVMGITGGTTKAHLARATLEAIAYQTRDVVEAMEADTRLKIPFLRVDGGGTANKFLLQFQSDILGISIQRTTIPDITALGATYLAGLATGIWKSSDELASSWVATETFEPEMSYDQRETLYAGWKRAIERVRSRMTC